MDEEDEVEEDEEMGSESISLTGCDSQCCCEATTADYPDTGRLSPVQLLLTTLY